MKVWELIETGNIDLLFVTVLYFSFYSKFVVNANVDLNSNIDVNKKVCLKEYTSNY